MSEDYLEALTYDLNNELSVTLPPEDLFKIKTILALTVIIGATNQKAYDDARIFYTYAKTVDDVDWYKPIR